MRKICLFPPLVLTNYFASFEKFRFLNIPSSLYHALPIKEAELNESSGRKWLLIFQDLHHIQLVRHFYLFCHIIIYLHWSSSNN